jgi:hypothetical protein
MSFDLARTPTLQAVATEDEQLLAQDLQHRVEESVALAEAQPDVVAAAEAQLAAEDRLARLKKAERTLSQFAKELREQAATGARAAIDALVESAAAGEKPDFKKLQGVSTIENQGNLARRAIERMVEHLIPLAQIAALRSESHVSMTRARATERVAQERAERVLGQMRDAVTEEMVLPIDLSKGVSGSLLAHAAGLKKIAIQISAHADELERAYSDRRKQ